MTALPAVTAAIQLALDTASPDVRPSAECLARVAIEAMPYKWLPIETAPKDGAEILAYFSGCGMIVVYWNEREWSDGTGFTLNPTHWMPLPLPAPDEWRR